MTGRWRKPPWIISTAACSVVSSASSVSGCGVMRSRTSVVSSSMPSATARRTSRSVRMPHISPPANTRTAPTSLLTIRLATSVSGRSGSTVSSSVDMWFRATGIGPILCDDRETSIRAYVRGGRVAARLGARDDGELRRPHVVVRALGRRRAAGRTGRRPAERRAPRREGGDGQRGGGQSPVAAGGGRGGGGGGGGVVPRGGGGGPRGW